MYEYFPSNIPLEIQQNYKGHDIISVSCVTIINKKYENQLKNKVRKCVIKCSQIFKNE